MLERYNTKRTDNEFDKKSKTKEKQSVLNDIEKSDDDQKKIVAEPEISQPQKEEKKRKIKYQKKKKKKKSNNISKKPVIEKKPITSNYSEKSDDDDQEETVADPEISESHKEEKKSAISVADVNAVSIMMPQENQVNNTEEAKAPPIKNDTQPKNEVSEKAIKEKNLGVTYYGMYINIEEEKNSFQIQYWTDDKQQTAYIKFLDFDEVGTVPTKIFKKGYKDVVSVYKLEFKGKERTYQMRLFNFGTFNRDYYEKEKYDRHGSDEKYQFIFGVNIIANCNHHYYKDPRGISVIDPLLQLGVYAVYVSESLEKIRELMPYLITQHKAAYSESRLSSFLIDFLEYIDLVLKKCSKFIADPLIYKWIFALFGRISLGNDMKSLIKERILPLKDLINFAKSYAETIDTKNLTEDEIKGIPMFAYIMHLMGFNNYFKLLVMPEKNPLNFQKLISMLDRNNIKLDEEYYKLFYKFISENIESTKRTFFIQQFILLSPRFDIFMTEFNNLAKDNTDIDKLVEILNKYFQGEMLNFALIDSFYKFISEYCENALNAIIRSKIPQKAWSSFEDKFRNLNSTYYGLPWKDAVNILFNKNWAILFDDKKLEKRWKCLEKLLLPYYQYNVDYLEEAFKTILPLLTEEELSKVIHRKNAKRIDTNDTSEGLVTHINFLIKVLPNPEHASILQKFISDLFIQYENHVKKWQEVDRFLSIIRDIKKISNDNAKVYVMDCLKKYIAQERFKVKNADHISGNPLYYLLHLYDKNPYYEELTDFAISYISLEAPTDTEIDEYLLKSPQKSHIWYRIISRNSSPDTLALILNKFATVWDEITNKTIKFYRADLINGMQKESRDIFIEYMTKTVTFKKIPLPAKKTVDKIILQFTNEFQDNLDDESRLRMFFDSFMRENFPTFIAEFDKIFINRENMPLNSIIIPNKFRQFVAIVQTIIDASKSAFFKLIYSELKSQTKITKEEDIIKLCENAYTQLKDNIIRFTQMPGSFLMKRVDEISTRIMNVENEIEIYKEIYRHEKIEFKPQTFEIVKETLAYYKRRNEFKAFCDNISNLLQCLSINDPKITEICVKRQKFMDTDGILTLNVRDFLSVFTQIDEYALQRQLGNIESNENRETFMSITIAITNAKELIDFTSSLKDEDIFNLKQSVTEFEEDLISKKTIFDFSIWCKFLKIMKNNAGSYVKLYNAIVTNAKLKEFRGIEDIIRTCAQQRLAIQSRHTQITHNPVFKKQQIEGLIKQSEFNINFSKESKNWEITAEYKHENMVQIKRFSYNEIIDLQQRAFFNLNTESDENNMDSNIPGVVKSTLSTKECLKRYIEIFSLFTVARNSLYELYSQGYPNLADYKRMKFKCINGVLSGEKIDEIIVNSKIDGSDKNNKENTENPLVTKCRNWNSFLNNFYMKSYQMSFLHGRQPWKLEKFFETKSLDRKNKYRKVAESILIFMGKELKEEKLLPFDIKVSPEERLIYLCDYISNLPDLIIKNDIGIRKEDLIKAGANSIILLECKKAIKGIFTVYNATGTKLPLSSQLLFCDRSTSIMEVKSFIYRAFMNKVADIHTVIFPEMLDFKIFLEMNNLIKELFENKFRTARIAFIVNTKNSQAYHEIINIGNYEVINIPEILHISQKELNEQIVATCKNTVIFETDSAGMGKTSAAKILAKQNLKKIRLFPITGELNYAEISKRLSVLDRLKEKILMVQFDNISEADKFEILLYQLIIQHCVRYQEKIIFLDCSIFLEISNNVIFESLEPFKSLPRNIIPDFNPHEIRFTDEHKFIAFYFDKYQKNALLYNTEMVKSSEISKFSNFSKEDCIRIIGNYISTRPNQIDSHIAMNVALKLLIYTLNSISYHLQVVIDEYYPEPSIKPIIEKIKTSLFESILLTIDEFTRKTIINLREIQRLTRLAENGDKAVMIQLSKLSDKNEIVSWDKIDHFLLFLERNGSLLPLYKDQAKIPKNIKDFIFLNEEIFRPGQNFENVVKQINAGNYSLPDLSTYNHEELFNKLKIIRNSQALVDKIGLAYKLTLDNTFKMVLIYMRAEAGIPIVIMGETGCGKTALVRFLVEKVLCETFKPFNIHAGITEDDIMSFMTDLIEIAKILEMDTINGVCKKVWIFFDEFNTSSALGLIKEIVCDRRMRGKKLPRNMVFIAACNPYKLRTKDPFSYENLGISKDILTDHTTKHLLEHFVHPIPETMLMYAWNFGSLTPADEEQYVFSILKSVDPEVYKIFVKCVYQSQRYYKDREEGISVSLRDVRRFTIFYSWFKEDLTRRESKELYSAEYEKIKIARISKFNRAGILSLIFCYYLRIQLPEKRDDYLKSMLPYLKESGIDSIDEIKQIIYAEKKFLLSHMNIPQEIAENTALTENIYTMFASIMNRLPLILIGKPGCSKSLSIQLLVSHIIGKSSLDAYFSKLPDLLMIYFQGSRSCISADILRVFERAESIVEVSSERKTIPVIVFDEISLAEMSPDNPLKVLHSKLEIDKEEDEKPENKKESYKEENKNKGIKQDIDNEERQSREKRIAFIAISNWKLDSSKMNRVIYVARPDPTEEDLCFTATQIFKNITQSEDADLLKQIRHASQAYFAFKSNKKGNKKTENYYGLRDFYAMIKQIAFDFRNSENISEIHKLAIICKSIERNFDKLESNLDQDHPMSACEEIINIYGKISHLGPEINKLQKSKVINLIQENLNNPNSRYLMLIGRGDTPHYILEHFLTLSKHPKKIMVGSKFKQDENQEEYAFKALSEVTNLTEKPITLILKGMEIVYSSLYDLFNQNFMIIGKRKCYRSAIGSQVNQRCNVDDNFHCIIFMDENQLPNIEAPFLNRFEKHYLEFNDIMDDSEMRVFNLLKEWVDSLFVLKEENKKIQLPRYQIFMEYSEDLLKILAMKYGKNAKEDEIYNRVRDCEKELIKLAGIELLILLNVTKISSGEIKFVQDCYNETHGHEFSDYISMGVKDTQMSKKVIYTFSPLTDIKSMSKENVSSKQISSYNKGENLIQDITNFYNSSTLRLLILDFDLQVDNDHIPFVKYTLENIEQDANSNDTKMAKNVIFVLHLKRNQRYEDEEPKLVIFEGWDTVMIDDLRENNKSIFTDEFFNMTTNQLLLEQKIIKIDNGILEVVEKCFMYIRYEALGNVNKYEINEKRNLLMQNILKRPELRKAFAQKIKSYIEKKHFDDWKIGMYNNPDVVASSDTSLDAIKNYLCTIIEKSLLIIIYMIENQMALQSYFNDSSPEIETIWLNYFENLQIDENLDIDQIINTTTIKYQFKLEFPFTYNEYQKNKACFTEIMNKNNTQAQFCNQCEDFEKYAIERSGYNPKFKEKIFKTDLAKLYWNDLVTQFLYDLKINSKYSIFIDEIFKHIFEKPASPLQKLFFLFSCETAIKSVLFILTSCEFALKNSELMLDIFKTKIELEKEQEINNVYFTSFLAVILENLCINFVLNPNNVSKLSEYARFLENYISAINDFTELTKMPIKPIDLLKFLVNYANYLNITQKNPEEQFIKILTKAKTTEIFGEPDFLKEIRKTAIENKNLPENTLDLVIKFLDECYFENFKKYYNQFENYIEDYNNLDLWKFSDILFDKLLGEDSNQLFENLINSQLSEDESIKNKAIFDIIEKYFTTEENFEKSYFAIIVSDWAYAQFTRSFNEPSEIDKFMEDYFNDFVTAYEFLTEPPKCEYPKYCKMLALGIIKGYLDAFIEKIINNCDEENEIIDEVNKILSHECNLAQTFSLYCCKKLFTKFEYSFTHLCNFIKGNPEKYPWMNIIKILDEEQINELKAELLDLNESSMDKEIIENAKKTLESEIQKKSTEILEAKNSIISLLNEEKIDIENYPFINFFRITNGIDLSFFKTSYINSPYFKTCPLIGYFLENSQTFKQLKALYPLIDFTNEMLDHCSHLYLRSDAIKIPIAEFLDKKPTLQEKYKRFLRKWSKYIMPLNEISGEKISEKKYQIELQEFSKDTKLADVLLDGKLNKKYETKGGALKMVLYHLGKFQNTILENANRAKNLENLERLKREKIKLQDLNADCIIVQKYDVEDFLAGCSNPRYGKGKDTFYDFEGIEKAIYSQFIKAKYIDLTKIRKITYQFEAFNRNSKLLSQIYNNTTQESMSDDLLDSLMQFLNKERLCNVSIFNDYLRNVYHSLTVLMFYAANDRVNSEDLLYEYCKKSNIHNTQKFLQQLFESSKFRVKHLIEIFEIIESMYFKFYQQYISPEYKRNINSSNIQKALENLYCIENPKKYAEILTKIPQLDLLRGTLEKIIMRKLTTTQNVNESLKYFLGNSEYWPRSLEKDKIPNLYINFPKEIALADIFELYNVIEIMIDKQNRRRVELAERLKEINEEKEETKSISTKSFISKSSSSKNAPLKIQKRENKKADSKYSKFMNNKPKQFH